MRLVAKLLAAGCLTVAAIPAYAQEQGPKPAVAAKKAMASANHPLVTKAMVEIMRKGGNAMDAAIAAVIIQPIVEPQMTTLAGGVSMLYYEAKTGKYYYLDAELNKTKKGSPNSPGWIAYTSTESRVGETSGIRIGVPGTVAGLKAAADRFGTLRWADYFKPAIDIAEKGFPMYSFLYGEMADAALGRLSAYPSGREEFLPNGYVPPVGTIVTRPKLAATMKRIGAEGPDYFYKGEWAKKFVAEAQRTGGQITMDDLASYSVRWEEPTRSTYKGYEIISAPPPSTAGALISMILNIIEPWDLKSQPHYSQSAEVFNRIRRTFAFAESATDTYVKDPLSFNVPLDTLLSKDYAAMMRTLIEGGTAKPLPAESAAAELPGVQVAATLADTKDQRSTDTDHLVAVDAEGNMVSVTHTVYGSTFATGLVVDGVAMNSGNPFPGTGTGAGRRVISPFPPTIVVKDGKPKLVIGSPGLSSRAVALTLINYLGYGMSIEQAVDAPRFQGSQIDLPAAIETRVTQQTRDDLTKLYGVVVRPTTPYQWHFGSIHAIEREADGSLLGVADPRRTGLAAGF
ncbi:gamma-glutamyltransferase family protein [Sphingomonas sp.]|uniref:gamma-glutamyltransferase family protein n=1 Tax=Sphingomonas sp. TaxID=28214 RepID=UPI003B3BDB45